MSDWEHNLTIGRRRLGSASRKDAELCQFGNVIFMEKILGFFSMILPWFPAVELSCVTSIPADQGLGMRI